MVEKEVNTALTTVQSMQHVGIFSHVAQYISIFVAPPKLEQGSSVEYGDNFAQPLLSRLGSWRQIALSEDSELSQHLRLLLRRVVCLEDAAVHWRFSLHNIIVEWAEAFVDLSVFLPSLSSY